MNDMRALLREQARACAVLDSPFMERLLGVVADRLQPGHAVADRILNWPGDPSARGDAVALRLAGGLHALILSRRDASLAAVYPPHESGDDALWAAVNAALTTHETFLLNWLDSPPQTNEVRRSVALIPLAHFLADRIGLPLILSELGASGGLNLHFDRFALKMNAESFGARDPALTLHPQWRGSLPPGTPFSVAGRRGVDLNPLTQRADDLQLRAYLWPDQPQRRALTDAALAAGPRDVDAGDVAPWLKHRLSTPYPGQLHLIYHTVAWQYFPEATKTFCAEVIEQAGAHATAQAPLAWFGMEVDDSPKKGAALTLRLWPGDVTFTLGRADFHGRWVEWQPQEIAT